ncbi:hypothetical protein COSO111634_36950 [Corallococcus soli]
MTYATSSGETVSGSGAVSACDVVSSTKRDFTVVEGSVPWSARWVRTSESCASSTMKVRRSGGKPGSSGT